MDRLMTYKMTIAFLSVLRILEMTPCPKLAWRRIKKFSKKDCKQILFVFAEDPAEVLDLDFLFSPRAAARPQ